MKNYTLQFLLIVLLLLGKVSIGQLNVELVDSVMTSKDFFNSDGFNVLNEESKSIALYFSVGNNISEMILQIGGIINSGSLTFEIYDSNKLKIDGLTFKNTTKGNFYIADDIPEKDNKGTLARNINDGKTQNPSEVEGLFLKVYEAPIFGTWEIRIIPNNATGKYKINYIRKHENQNSK